MVGVPGRSKGCRTCRKRKKGCDLERPECGQCKERGLECGGYDRDRMFVHQTPGVVTAVQPTTTSSSTAVRHLSIVHGRSVPDRFSSPRSGRDLPLPFSGSIVLPDSLAGSAYSEQSLENYINLFLPSNSAYASDRASLQNTGALTSLPSLCLQDGALRLVVLALSESVAGLDRNDRALLERGKRLYGRGLVEMNRALRDGSRSRTEALLAAPGVMGLFEILFGADLDVKLQANSWQSHAEGELALIKSRGPDAFVDGPAHRVFLEGRSNPIIAAIRVRKATPLNHQKWKTVPWSKKPKSPRDRLLDILVCLPEILEEVDNVRFAQEDDRARLSRNITSKCLDVEDQLDQWITSYRDCVHLPSNVDVAPIDFPNLTTAFLTVYYWVCRLILYQAMGNVFVPFPSTALSFSYPSQDKNPAIYARLIARSIDPFFAPEAGIWGPVNISFPMGHALLLLRACEGDENEDKNYATLIYRSFGNPKLPNAIRRFLNSMRANGFKPPV